MRVIFLILFIISAASGIWTSLDAVFYTPKLFDLAAEYHVIYPYYILLGFYFWGGFALFYTLLRRNEWGYGLGLVWVWTNIINVVLFAVTMSLNTTLLFRYFLAATPADERNISGLAESVGSGAYTAGIVAGSLGVALFGFIYLWILIRNRDYFSNTSAI